MSTTAFVSGTHVLEGVSAASGLELSADGSLGYIVGDNSVFLYVVETAPGKAVGKVIRKTKIVDSKDTVDEEIAKKVKPDFECMLTLPIAGVPHIVAVGSGSKAVMRDNVVSLNTETGVSTEYNAQALMDALRADKRITGTAKLNLEAAAIAGSSVCLFHRGNVPGSFNSVAVWDAAEFIAFLTSLPATTREGGVVTSASGAAAGGAGATAAVAAVPAYRVVHLTLPPVTETAGLKRSFPAGVSGASTMTASLGAASAELLVVSASYEGTLNEIDDGDVLGSRVAVLPSSLLLAAAGATAASGLITLPADTGIPTIDLSPYSAMIAAPEAPTVPVIAKAEGIAGRGSKIVAGADGKEALVIDAMAVTDPDGEASQALLITISLDAQAVRVASGLA